MKKFFLWCCFLLYTLVSCNKEHLPEFYFRCKVNGQSYIPDKCANCVQAEVIGDTVLILGGNKGFETLGIGIRDLGGIKVSTYLLNQTSGRRGDYKFTPATNDRYFTNDMYTGYLTIASIDKVNKIITGNFSYKAYNALRNDVVDITEGKFRLRFKNY